MQENISYKKATLLVMIITLMSKITAFFRETVLGSTYRAIYITHAYLVSYTIPQMLFANMTAAIIATTYISLYSMIKVDRGNKEAARVTNK